MQATALALIGFLWVAGVVGQLGSKKEITDENVKQELLADGVAKLTELKAASNGPACAVYTGRVISATEQTVDPKTPKPKKDECRHFRSSPASVDLHEPILPRSKHYFLFTLPMFTAKEGPTLGNIITSVYIATSVIFISTVVNVVMALVTLCYAAKQAIVQMDDGLPGTPRDWVEWEEDGRTGPLPYVPRDRDVQLLDEGSKMKRVRARFLPGGGGYEEVRVASKLLDKLEEEGYGTNVEVVECEGDADSARLVTGERDSWTRVLK